MQSSPPRWCQGYPSDDKDVYSYNFPNDGKRTKLLGMQIPSLPILQPSDSSCIVYGIFSLVTVQTVLNGADLFYWFASGYGNLNDLFNPFLSPYEGPILESLVSAIVQFFYSYRIWVITNKQFWWLCLFICLVRRSLVSPKHRCLSAFVS